MGSNFILRGGVRLGLNLTFFSCINIIINDKWVMTLVCNNKGIRIMEND